MEKSLVVGIDIGAQSSKLGVVDAKGNILCQSVITSLQPTLDEYVNDLTAAIEAGVRLRTNSPFSLMMPQEWREGRTEM